MVEIFLPYQKKKEQEKTKGKVVIVKVGIGRQKEGEEGEGSMQRWWGSLQLSGEKMGLEKPLA